MQQRSSFPLNREFDVSLNLNLTRLNRVKPGLGESCESDRETKRTRGSVKRERKKKKGTVLEKKKRVHDAYSLSVTRWFTLIYRRRSGTHPHRIPRGIGFNSKTFRSPLDLTSRRVRVPRNFTSKFSTASCFPTNRSTGDRSSAATRTRDTTTTTTTTTKEATISKKRTMTRRMKKRPQENRRCYGFAKAFLSERFSTPTRSVAVTSSGQILNEAARSRLTNNFGTSTASGHRSAVLSVNLSPSKATSNTLGVAPVHTILVILQTLPAGGNAFR